MKKEKHICCICGKEFKGYGNNPYPIKSEGICCNECNRAVILARLSEYKEN
jgi:hypothetical protein